MGAGDCCGEGRDCADDGAAPGDEMWAVLDVSADIAAAEFTRTSGAAVDVVCETVLRFAVKGSRKVGGSAHDLSMQARLICRDSIVGGVRQQQGVVVGLDCWLLFSMLLCTVASAARPGSKFHWAVRRCQAV